MQQQQGLPPIMELEQLRGMEKICETMLRGIQIRERLVCAMDNGAAEAVASINSTDVAIPLTDFIESWATVTRAHAALMEFENEQQRANVERDLGNIRARIKELESGIIIARGSLPQFPSNVFGHLNKSDKGGN